MNDHRRFSVITLLLGIGLLIQPSLLDAQISRNVGDIAVIEGDNSIISTPNNAAGTPCPQVTVNMAEVAKKFYATHGDVFRMLIVFTTFNHLLLPDAACNEQANAFYLPVSNTIEGIGRTMFDTTSQFGSSAGVLAGVLNMGSLGTRPIDPAQRLPNNNDSMLSLLSQEVGHYWSAYSSFDSSTDPTIVTPSTALLGRASQHWSFFSHMPSLGATGAQTWSSSLEGNFWQQPTPGQFITTSITDGFSNLDLYLMGLISPEEVGSISFIAAPTNVVPPTINAGSPPQAGVTASGTFTSIGVSDIIAVDGERTPRYNATPPYTQSAKIFRQAFILLTPQDVDATQAQIAQVDAYRERWEMYFDRMTMMKGAAVTQLGYVVFVGSFLPWSLAQFVDTIREGQEYLVDRGTIGILAGKYSERDLTFDKPFTLRALLGTVTIGEK
jgi:hypothetical protein